MLIVSRLGIYHIVGRQTPQKRLCHQWYFLVLIKPEQHESKESEELVIHKYLQIIFEPVGITSGDLSIIEFDFIVCSHPNSTTSSSMSRRLTILRA